MEINETMKTQYLFFYINEKKYAIKAHNIQEIVEHINITTIPRCNSSIKGVINVRGDLIGVVDPQRRLGIGESRIEKRTAFIIFNLRENDNKISIALMVDLVIEVKEIANDKILKTPEFGTKIDPKYIENIIHYNNEHVDVLNIETVLNIDELSLVD